eukprot:628045-Prorocentrum_lima.AAC.1
MCIRDSIKTHQQADSGAAGGARQRTEGGGRLRRLFSHALRVSATGDDGAATPSATGSIA